MPRPPRNQFKADSRYHDLLMEAIKQGMVYLDDRSIATGLGKIGAKTEAFVLQKRTVLVPKPGLKPVNRNKNSTIFEF